MKILISTFVLLFSSYTLAFELQSGLSPVEDFKAQSFCAQTFNVYGPAYASGVQNRLDRLVKELASDPCDIIQFQELWRENNYNPFRDELERAQYTTVRADEIRGDRSIIGLASALKGQINDKKSALFAVNNEDGVMDGIRNAAGVQKGYTFITASVKNSSVMTLVNLHTHPSSEAIRVAQVAQLVNDLIGTPEMLNKAIVLMGDLNATPDSTELALLTSLLNLRDSYIEANTSYGQVCTYCANNPLSWSRENRVIDFVLISNSLNHKLKTTSSIVNLKGPSLKQPLSDHYGVRSEISFSAQTERELSPESPLVKARTQKAIESLNRAVQSLSKETGRGFREAAFMLRTWRDELNAGKPNPVFERIFRTP